MDFKHVKRSKDSRKSRFCGVLSFLIFLIIAMSHDFALACGSKCTNEGVGSVTKGSVRKAGNKAGVSSKVVDEFSRSGAGVGAKSGPKKTARNAKSKGKSSEDGDTKVKAVDIGKYTLVMKKK